MGKLILTLAVVVATWLVVGPMFQDADAKFVDTLSTLDDSDNDGMEDFYDDCPCTTGETQRDLDGTTWCVARQDPGAFTELKQSFNTEGEQMQELEKEGYREQEGTVYYTKNLCAYALSNNVWP